MLVAEGVAVAKAGESCGKKCFSSPWRDYTIIAVLPCGLSRLAVPAKHVSSSKQDRRARMRERVHAGGVVGGDWDGFAARGDFVAGGESGAGAGADGLLSVESAADWAGDYDVCAGAEWVARAGDDFGEGAAWEEGVGAA